MKYEILPLLYDFDALEPHLDAKTMEIHYTKHYKGYLDKLNAVLEKYPDVDYEKPEDLLINLKDLQVEEKDIATIKNNCGGFINHNLFWEILGPKKEIDEKLVFDIKAEFGSLEEFKQKFNEIAKGHFASGWAWLVRDENNKLQIYSLPDHDSPYEKGHTPILVLDVWEHAYYLKYQNKRADFIDAWWEVLRLV